MSRSVAGCVVAGCVVATALTILGCEAPRVVDCTSEGASEGRLVEAGGDFWCVYPRLMFDPECPRLVPFEHDLPWGGTGCATREHRPLPADLCAAAGACAPDGGTP